MSTDTWNPVQYEKFKAERDQPAIDLMGLLEPVKGATLLDLGCGTGELTRKFHETVGAKETLAIDGSDAMLARAKAMAAPGIRFESHQIEKFVDCGQRFDIVCSNAALQWVPDHEWLIPKIAGLVEKDGQLAVQIPANRDHVTYQLVAEVASESPFREALQGYIRRLELLAPERYAELLHQLGFKRQRVELRVYPHLLPSRQGVVEWVKGTLLTDYERRLPAPVFASFLEVYQRRLVSRLADETPFFYPFKRILFWGRR